MKKTYKNKFHLAVKNMMVSEDEFDLPERFPEVCGLNDELIIIRNKILKKPELLNSSLKQNL
jgi:hypothetical protein